MAGLVQAAPGSPSSAISPALASVSLRDNSNPQQGSMSGAQQSGHPKMDDSSGNRASVPATSTAAHGGRPSLKIPPHRKDSRKLFVGGLPVDITEDEFRTFFQRFGKLIDCIVMVDRDTNRSRGFGFVSYEDPEVARELLAKGNDGHPSATEANAVGRLEMRGKMIEIKAAQPRDVAPNRRHYHRSIDQRRPSHQASSPSLPSMNEDHNAPSSTVVPSYEYSGPAYYPYMYPQATSAYFPSGYYPLMTPAPTGGDVAYHASFSPSFGYEVAGPYSPYGSYSSHLYATSATHASPPIPVRRSLIHSTSPRSSGDDASASTGVV